MNFKKEPRLSVESGDRGLFKNTGLVVAGVILLAIGIFFRYANQLVVAIIPENDRPKICFTAPQGEVWNISFKHSYQLTIVEEYFRVNDVNDMTMTHTIYKSLGCGFPFSGNEGGLECLADGRFKLTMNRPYKELKMRPAVQAGQKIVHGDTVYNLCELFGHGTLLTIKAEKRYEYWLE